MRQTRITAINVPGVTEYVYAYDPAGNITGITDRLNSGLSKSYAYDPADRLASASGSWGNLAWTYDAKGNRLTQSLGTATDTYAYNANRLMSITSGSETRNYQYDAKGSIVNDGVREFAYNQNSRLIRAAQNGAVSGEYIYNSFGQRAVKKTGGETTVFLYDLSGNLIAEADGSGEIMSEYIYLGSTLLAAVKKGVSAIEATVDFDPDTLNLKSYKGTWVTCYIELPEEYDAADILCGTVKLNGAVPCEKSDAGDYDKDGIPDIMVKFDREKVASLLQPADTVTVTVDGMAKTEGKNAEIPVLAYAEPAPDNAETTAVYYFHCDHLGTPQAITDKNGNIVWKADYKPFGEITLTTAAVENNFRFPGQFYDAETGLHYNWHRYYDAGTGRYLTPDPIGLEGGINLYAYVMNNPVRFSDLFGLILLYQSPKIKNAIIELKEHSPTARKLIEILESIPEVAIGIFTTEEEHLIHDLCWGLNQYDPQNKAVIFEPDRNRIYDGSKKWMHRPPEIGLAHELVHALQHIEGREIANEGPGGAIAIENKIRKEYGIEPSPETYQLPGGGFNNFK